MSEFERIRREMHKALNKPGARPDPALRVTRRTFLHRSLIAGGAAGAASFGWFPLLNTIDIAYGAEEAFKFAWISDTHLYPKSVNERFVEKTVRAAKEVQAMNPPADFLIFGGDIAQLGRAEELELGNEILKEVKIRKVFIPGEHDWYYDMGKRWRELYDKPSWTFDHKGVRFIGLDTISRAPDYWSATKMSPEERMNNMATLDGNVAGPWAAVGSDGIEFLQKTLSDWGKSKPVVIFSHNPLYEYYPRWNFWVRDWQQVNEVLAPYTNITNIHGHTHQVLYNEIGHMRCIGMLATSWPWPYAPQGVPALTKVMIRADPGDIYDGVGWSKLGVTAADKVENEYIMWGRKTVFAQSLSDSSLSHPEVLHPRIADQMWQYKD
jgi:3',5'-cyclic-AMP phosphodiesterase